MRPWSGDWLALSVGSWPTRTDQRRAERAFRYLGLRPGLARLWLRPDNLAMSRAELASRLDALGASGVDELFTARGFSEERVARWRIDEWDVPGLEKAYAASLRDVERSLARVHRLPADDALVETFLHGGQAIRLIALDPLLPAELVDTHLRRALFERMSEYDRVGRAKWHERFGIGRGAGEEAVQ